MQQAPVSVFSLYVLLKNLLNGINKSTSQKLVSELLYKILQNAKEGGIVDILAYRRQDILCAELEGRDHIPLLLVGKK